MPDAKHQFVTAGFGEWKKADYATAALADDGSCAVVYLPSPRTITVNLTRFRGPVVARWFDPTSGQFKAASEKHYPNQGEATFYGCEPNAAAEGDWALVVSARESIGPTHR